MGGRASHSLQLYYTSVPWTVVVVSLGSLDGGGGVSGLSGRWWWCLWSLSGVSGPPTGTRAYGVTSTLIHHPVITTPTLSGVFLCLGTYFK